MSIFGYHPEGGTVTEAIRRHLQMFGKTERYRDLERYWAIYWGVHYEIADLHEDELEDWHDSADNDNQIIPIWKRKPLIPESYGKVLVDRLANLIVGPTNLPSQRVVNQDGALLEQATKTLEALHKKLGWTQLWGDVCPWTLTQGTGVPCFYVPRPG